ncbi:diacylglycerol lipase-beta-like [Ischnura elegans]|uniref:diacylglycerol lipase-beta-like n=1 Tax=Ischnura elegans TaxID=197161 RepID=UPI001ED8BD6C|nr:diacylglycerol lipase-beta-like [Ischnura elegans]
MPGVTLLGRRWQVASDDFVLPSSLDALLRATWLTLICYVIYRLYPSWDCLSREQEEALVGAEGVWGGRGAVRTFLALCSVLLLAQVITAVLLAGESSKGSIMDVQARRFVTPLLTFRFFLTLLDVLWNAVGSAWILGGHWPRCESESLATSIIEGLLVFQWVWYGVLVFGMLSVYDPMGLEEKRWERTRRQWRLAEGGGGEEAGVGGEGALEKVDWEEADREIERRWHELSSATWRRRFRAVLCCSWIGDFRGSREAFKEVSELFSSLLRGTRLVPSDVAAGLVLLRIREKRERRQCRCRGEDEEDARCVPHASPPPFHHHALPEATKDSSPPPWMKLDSRVARYLRYSQGAYGWPYLMYLHCITGLCKLIPKTTCCVCLRRSKARKVEDDNCCLCGMAALKVISKTPDEDILYASFQNGYYQAPFVVLLDHETKSVVIAIRGSITVRDIFTDFCAASTDFCCPELPPGSAAHKGMLQTARYIQNKIEESGALKQAFESHPHYNLVVTGHSLGGGVSVLLGVLLRPSYPDLRCYSFSPPAGLLSREAARFTERFVLSVGLGHDLVMRLGVDTIENLRTRLLDTVYKCALPKYRIILSGFLYTITGIPSKALQDSVWKMDHEAEDKMVKKKSTLEAIPGKHIPFPCLYGPPISAEASVLDRDIGKRRFSQQRLYSPGRILHLMYRKRNRDEKGRGRTGPRFEAFWRQPEHFLQLEVMPRMVLDHLPENVLAAVNDILNHHDLAGDTT